jgi:hypothetical protein
MHLRQIIEGIFFLRKSHTDGVIFSLPQENFDSFITSKLLPVYRVGLRQDVRGFKP